MDGARQMISARPDGLVGRDQAVDRLIATLGGHGGRPRSAVLVGEPGIGTSAVADAALAALDLPVIHLADLGDYSWTVGPLLARRVCRDRPTTGDVGDLAALIREFAGLPVTGPVTPRCAVQVEGSDRADPRQISRVVTLARMAAQHGIPHLFVVDPTAPESLEPMGLDRVELSGLGVDAVHTLLQRWSGGPVPRTVARQIWRRTDGNPGLLRELVARCGPTVLRGGSAVPCPLPATRLVRRVRPPEDSEIRSVLAGFAFTDRVPPVVLAAVAATPVIDTLLGRGLLVDEADEFRARSALTALAAWHSADTEQRRQVVSRFHAAWLAVDPVTAHARFPLSDDPAEAAVLGRRARGLGRWDEAISLLRRAVSQRRDPSRTDVAMSNAPSTDSAGGSTGTDSTGTDSTGTDSTGTDSTGALAAAADTAWADLVRTQIDAGHLDDARRTFDQAPPGTIPTTLSTAVARLQGDLPWRPDSSRPGSSTVPSEPEWLTVSARVGTLLGTGDIPAAMAELRRYRMMFRGPLAQLYLAALELEIAVLDEDVVAADRLLPVHDWSLLHTARHGHRAVDSLLRLAAAMGPGSAPSELLRSIFGALTQSWADLPVRFASARGFQALIDGDHDAAGAALATALHTGAEGPFRALRTVVDLVESDIARRDPTTALMHWCELRPAEVADTAPARALQARAAALLAEPADIDVAFVAALTRSKGPLPTVIHARTLLAYGRKLLLADRRTEAARRLQEALGLFSAMGLGGWVRHIEALLRTADPEQAAPLTSMGTDDEQLLTLVTQGHTNREIAQKLFVSVRTVENRLGRLYRRAGVARRTDLVRLHAGRPGHTEPVQLSHD